MLHVKIQKLSRAIIDRSFKYNKHNNIQINIHHDQKSNTATTMKFELRNDDEDDKLSTRLFSLFASI